MFGIRTDGVPFVRELYALHVPSDHMEARVPKAKNALQRTANDSRAMTKLEGAREKERARMNLNLRRRIRDNKRVMGHRFWGLVYAVPESYWERAIGTSGRNVKREEEREREKIQDGRTSDCQLTDSSHHGPRRASFD